MTRFNSLAKEINLLFIDSACHHFSHVPLSSSVCVVFSFNLDFFKKNHPHHTKYDTYLIVALIIRE